MDIPVTAQSKWTLGPRIKTIGGVVVLVVLAFLSQRFFTSALPSIEQENVWVSEVKQGDFIREVRGVGVLVPSEIRWIAAISDGRVERVLVKPGAVVTADTVIAELSNPDLMSQRQQAQWDLDAAEANLLALDAQLQEQTLEQELLVTQAQMALESAKLREKAEKPLAEKHIISELDFANTQLQTTQKQTELKIRLKTQQRRTEVVNAKLRAEEANVLKYQNLVDLYDRQINALKITADIDGVLQQVSVDVGQRVEIGSNVAQVANPASLMAELQVQENRVQDLQIGHPVTVDTRNGLVEGIVKRIDPRVQNGNVQVDVTLVSQLPSGARPDLSITGTITVEHIADTLYVERPVGTVAQSQIKLFTLTSDTSQAKQRDITLGKASVSTIQIIAGLQPGDQVIVSDMSEFTQFNAVQLTQ